MTNRGTLVYTKTHNKSGFRKLLQIVNLEMMVIINVTSLHMEAVQMYLPCH